MPTPHEPPILVRMTLDTLDAKGEIAMSVSTLLCGVKLTQSTDTEAPTAPIMWSVTGLQVGLPVRMGRTTDAVCMLASEKALMKAAIVALEPEG